MAKIKQPVKKGFFHSYKFQLGIITLLVFVLYARTIRFEFVNMDDTTLILDNYKFIHDLGNLKAAFINDVFYNPQHSGGIKGYYRPLMTLSFMFDSQFGGQSPGFYHFMNILFHLACCFLLFRFFLLMRYRAETAFFGTILFAVHPALSQAISWIPGRNDTLLTLFILASFICFIRYLETNDKLKWWLHVLFFALAIFTKESAVFLPLIIFLYYILLYKQEMSGVKHGFKARDLRIMILGYVLVLFPWFLIRQHVISHTSADLAFSSLAKNFIINLPIWFQVIQKIIAPYNLSIISIVKDTNFIVSILLIIVIISLLVFSKQKRGNYILFGFIWFNVFLLPAFVVPILTGFEHRGYLPLIGFLIIIFEIDYLKNLTYKKPASIAFISIIVGVFVLINFNHTSAFSNHISFWEKAATNSPNSSLAKLNYGYALWEQGKDEEALKVYNEGLAINPEQPMIHNDLGILYGQEGKFEDAEKEFKEENRINPNYSAAYYNLGILYEKMRKEDEMVAAWKQALSIDTNNFQARNALNGYYQRKGGMQ